MNTITERLKTHFAGRKSIMYWAMGLFVSGIAVFVFNNTLLFFMDEQDYFWPRLCMKGLTDMLWFAASLLGTKYYPTKRNKLLMYVLVFYILGDIAVFFSIPVGGAFYGAGHIFMLWTILETTYIHSWQRILFVILIILPVALLPVLVKDVRLIFIGIIYGAVVTAVLVFSLSNRFFRVAGVVFYVSDIAGLLRITGTNNKITYVITTAIYFAAFFMLCISVYNRNRKEVVTWNDLFRMLNDSKSGKVSFWVCGRWALDLIKGDRHFSYDRIDLAYDIDDVDQFLLWLKHARYEKKQDYSEEQRIYYSEKYGELRVFPCLFHADGSAVLTTGKGHRLILDDGFFEVIKVFRKRIPCIAPGGQELISEVLNT